MKKNKFSTGSMVFGFALNTVQIVLQVIGLLTIFIVYSNPDVANLYYINAVDLKELLKLPTVIEQSEMIEELPRLEKGGPE